MEIGEKLYKVGVELIKKRYPKGWGGVGVAYTNKGSILTSLALEVFNASTELCIETGVILEAYKLDEKITHILTIVRDDEKSDFKILTSCGICQERLNYFGKDLKCAISTPTNEIIFKTLEELQPYHWSKAYQD